MNSSPFGSKGSALIPIAQKTATASALRTLLAHTMDQQERLLICFECNNMLGGRTCLTHHLHLCCTLPKMIRIYYRPMTEPEVMKNAHPPLLKWIDCNMCDLQRRLRASNKKQITCTSRWTRLMAKLFLRRALAERIRTLTRMPPWSGRVLQLIFEFLV